MNKTEFIRNLDKKGIFWSYDLTKPEELPDSILTEQVLRWGDVPDIITLFELFDFNIIKQVWETSLIPDSRIFSHNYYLARVFFDIDDANEYLKLKSKQNSRYERLKQLAS